MKRTLYLICMGSLALAMTARGEEPNQWRRGKAARNASTTQQTTTSVKTHNYGQARTQRSVSTPRFQQRNYSVTPRTNSTVVHRNSVRNTRFQPDRRPGVSTSNAARTRSSVTVNRQRNFGVERDRTARFNRERNATFNRERNVTVNRERNITVNRERNGNFANRRNGAFNQGRHFAINNNWRGERFSGQHYAAFRNYHRQWHDRGWWRNHHTRIIFVSGGWYCWDAGYWYPAWGYDPGYSYPYDGPIYGYNDLSPDQVVVNVQEQLQRDGYYSGEIDGVLGPETREAIAAFQSDHGLAVTSAVDEPTLASLGLV